MLIVRNDAMVEALENDLVGRSEVRVGSLVSEFLMLPGLRGLWTQGPLDGSGNVLDQSGLGMTMSRGLTPTTSRFYIVPILQAATGYLTRADEANLDIIGTESYVASAARGLTLGGWFYLDTVVLTSHSTMLAKWDTTGNQRSYRLALDTDGSGNNYATFDVSSNGTAVTSVTATDSIQADKWYFYVGRYDPSTEMALFVQGLHTKYTNTTSISASIFNSTSALEIAREEPAAGNWRGNVAVSFLCTMALSDAIIDHIFNKSVAAFDKRFVIL